MKFPSLNEIVDIVREILTITSEGGQKAVLLLFIICFFGIIIGAFLLVRFILNFVKQSTEAKEKALAAKDDLLEKARIRQDAVIEQYAKYVAQSIEKDQAYIQEVRELRTLITVFLTNRN